MNVFFIILGFLLVWVLEIIPLKRDKDMGKELCYSVLMFMSLSVSLVVLFCNKETSIAAVIEKIMKTMIKSMRI